MNLYGFKFKFVSSYSDINGKFIVSCWTYNPFVVMESNLTYLWDHIRTIFTIAK